MVTRSLLKSLLWGVAAAAFLSGCDTPPDILVPTLMLLPSPTEIADRPTLPPTWTASPAPTETALGSPTPTATDTLTPSQTWTPVDTATPTSTLPPTPQGDAAVIGANGANLRPGPSRQYTPPVALLPTATELRVIGRNASATWYEVATFDGLSGWVSADLIDIRPTAVNIPVTWVEPPTPVIPFVGVDPSIPQPPTSPASSIAYPPADPGMLSANSEYLFTVSQQTRQIFNNGQSLGNRANSFTKVGDSITATQPFLLPFAGSDYDLGAYVHLQESIDYFRGSFDAGSMAASSAFNAAAVLSSVWVDEMRCSPNESPLVCEYRTKKPAVAIIMLGSVDVQIYGVEEYRAAMEQVIATSISFGVIPVLTTFPNGGGYYDNECEQFNNVIRDLASANGLPIIDLRAAAGRLPNNGVGPDKYHLSVGGNRVNFTGEEWQYGLTLRDLLTLQALDLLRRDLMG